jgi:hypothetical protein
MKELSLALKISTVSRKRGRPREVLVYLSATTSKYVFRHSRVSSYPHQILKERSRSHVVPYLVPYKKW